MKKRRLEILTDSPEATMRLGRQLARCLVPDAVIALSGQLGSGKTTLVKGIAWGLGIDWWEVDSPSFVLIREYEGGRLPLFHCDFYRLENIRQIGLLGLEDYFNRQGVLVMEWAEKAGGFLPDEYLYVDIFFAAKHKRRFKFLAKGKTYQTMVEKLRVKGRGLKIQKN